MQTIDDLGRALRKGEMTVDDVLVALQGQDVVVYPGDTVTEPEQKTWQSVEEDATGSSLMADLQNAGADEDTLFEVGAHIERARQEGRTLDKVYPRAAEGTTPGMSDQPTGPTGNTGPTGPTGPDEPQDPAREAQNVRSTGTTTTGNPITPTP